MNTQAIIQSQYRAALDMLRAAIRACPDDLWLDSSYTNPAWHIAYHVLFYTHLYLQESGATFSPWQHHRPEYEFLGPIPWEQNRKPRVEEPYTKDEVLAFFEVCWKEVELRVPAADLEAESGFDWLPFSKLELQFYNIRHLQHHTGQLSERIRTRTGVGIGWIGHRPQETDSP
jgi:hypothetical protein